MTDMTTIANNMGASIKAFRSAAVTAEGKATPMARAILAALAVGVATDDKVIAATIASFGNPKSSKTGKPVTGLSGLREFVGGDAVRKTVESILKIHANVKSDETLKPLVHGFILENDGAPKSLRALDVAIKDAMRAAEAADMGTGDEQAETVIGNSDQSAPVVSTLEDRLNKLALEIAGLSDEDFIAADSSLDALRKAIAARYDAFLVASISRQNVAA